MKIRMIRRAALLKCTVWGAVIAVSLWKAVATAQVTTASATFVSVRSGRWSDQGVWQAGRFPGQGDAVIIAEGTMVQLDRNVSLASLTVSGSGAILLCPQNSDLPPRADDFLLVLDVATIFLIEKGGCFTCGAGDCQSEPEQYAGRLMIRLRSETSPSTPDEDVRTLLVRDGGALYLSGRSRSPGITRLASHALQNDASIVVSDVRVMNPDSGWRAGDLIAIAPTGYAPSQTEYRRVASVALAPAQDATLLPRATIQLDAPLVYAHNGRSLKLAGSPRGAGDFLIDTRAEVALLSRSIVIEGVAGDPSGLGGDVKIVGRSSRVLVKWCEFRFLGRRGHLGRYPLHLHGAAEGAIVTGVSVHDSYQRGVVLHCTIGAQVTDTVVAGVYGFAFMLEDGAEENNVLSGNLAMDVLNAIPNTTGSVITEHGNPAGFWFVNPANSFVGNMAAGVHGSGFSWEMLRNRTASYTLCPQEVPGYNVSLLTKQQYSALDASVYGSLMRKNFVAFRNNSAHSMHSAIWFRNTGEPSSQAFFPANPSSIGSLAAWRILPRVRAPPGVDGSQHDGCIHVFGMSRLKFERMACVNSPHAYWSSSSNHLNDTLIAWIGEDDDDALLGPFSLDGAWRKSEVLTSYTNPPTFVNTHLHGRYGRAIFYALGMGSIASTNTIVNGFTYTHDVGLNDFDLVLVSSLSPHVFTDQDGSLLDAGPGARVLSSCPGCGTNTDPIVEEYAAGACVPVGNASSNSGPSNEYVSEPRPKSGGIIRAIGAGPLLCAGPNAPRFSIVQLFAFSSDGPPYLDFHVYSGRGQYLRAISPRSQNTAFFITPMTGAAMAAAAGYRIVSLTGWSGIKELVVTLGPVTDVESDGMTIVLVGIPPGFRYAVAPIETKVNASINTVGNNSSFGMCATLMATCAARAAETGAPCVCPDSSGDIYIRLVGSPTLPDPNAVDSRGQSYLFQSLGVHINWGNTFAASGPTKDFAQLAKYLRGDPVG